MKTMGSRGFTLIELLVVMAVLTLVLVFVPPIFSSGLSTAALKAAARDVAAGLRQARSEAITQNMEVAVIIDVENRRYTIDGDAGPHSLPPELQITLHTAESEKLDETRGSIRFFPDGSSTGGGVTLANDARRFRVVVDWLTGRVSIDR